ncbi:MAG: type II toxin-antitoxin system VapC family toxin, partial [Pseudomonadota bacterium]
PLPKPGSPSLKYLLDTNTVSALMKGMATAAAHLARIPRADVGISQVTVAEIEFGLRYLPASRRRRLLQQQWGVIGPELIRLPWDDPVSRVFGERKARLERAGKRMSDFDLAIAAHAIAHRLIVVTADGGFERLRIRRENWLI